MVSCKCERTEITIKCIIFYIYVSFVVNRYLCCATPPSQLRYPNTYFWLYNVPIMCSYMPRCCYPVGLTLHCINLPLFVVGFYQATSCWYHSCMWWCKWQINTVVVPTSHPGYARCSSVFRPGTPSKNNNNNKLYLYSTFQNENFTAGHWQLPKDTS